METDIAKVLHDEAEILHRVGVLAEKITEDYRGKEWTAVSILNGSLIFAADLLRRVPLPLKIENWRVSSYHGAKTSGEVKFHMSDVENLEGRHLLIIEDILDTGLTLAAIRERLFECGALSVKVCVLLRKDVSRLCEIEADYVGFDIPNEFVVGYGLDYNQQYRNLPYIGVLTPEAIARG